MNFALAECDFKLQTPNSHLAFETAEHALHHELAELREIQDHELLRKVLARVKAADSPDDLRRVWTRKRRPKAAKSE